LAPISPIFKENFAERFEFPDVMVSGEVYTVYVVVFKVFYIKKGQGSPSCLIPERVR
jgi:hypothetical protein